MRVATNNLLYDPITLHLTALLDFDWSHIATIADEYLQSFGDFGGQLPGPDPSEIDQMRIHEAFLNGFSSPTPHLSDASMEDWENAKRWDYALSCAGAERPHTMKGISQISGLYWLSEQLCPWLLSNELVISQRDPAELEVGKQEGESKIAKYLTLQAF